MASDGRGRRPCPTRCGDNYNASALDTHGSKSAKLKMRMLPQARGAIAAVREVVSPWRIRAPPPLLGARGEQAASAAPGLRCTATQAWGMPGNRCGRYPLTQTRPFDPIWSKPRSSTSPVVHATRLQRDAQLKRGPKLKHVCAVRVPATADRGKRGLFNTSWRCVAASTCEGISNILR